MIETLALSHDEWVKMAYKICGNRDYANDLVQEMYLKLHDSSKEISAGYVYMTIRSIFIDEKRKEKREQTTTLYFDIEEEPKPDFDIDEHERFVITKEMYDSMEVYEKLIIRYSHEDGLRKFSRDSGISIATVQRIRNKHRLLVWQKLKEQKESKEREILLLRSQLQLGLHPVQIVPTGKMF